MELIIILVIIVLIGLALYSQFNKEPVAPSQPTVAEVTPVVAPAPVVEAKKAPAKKAPAKTVAKKTTTAKKAPAKAPAKPKATKK